MICGDSTMFDARSNSLRTAIATQRQITGAAHGHVLTNVNVWSPDGKWIVYDVRSDPAGSSFDGRRIEIVHTQTGEVRLIHESKRGANCGVATFSPIENKIAFIHGPEQPTHDWSYSAWHRDGVIIDLAGAGTPVQLDGRDITPPFTPGALRGGSHVHIFSGDGRWFSFTYEDHVLATLDRDAFADADLNQRTIGVSAPARSIHVPRNHPRNHDGSHFTVLVTRTHNAPRAGSDEIQRACEEGWVGGAGYLRADGVRQRRALAFQGQVISEEGKPVSEVFIVDIPDDITQPGQGPLQGTPTTRPLPPRGCVQRRLTRTTHRLFPGIQGPRHWLRSSPDGARIAFLMKDDAGIVQLFTVSPQGGTITQVTHNDRSIASAFTWSPDGASIACIIDRSVCIIDAHTGQTTRLTQATDEAASPRPEACVYSPDGRQIAFVRTVDAQGMRCNQIFTVDVPL